MKRIWIGCIFLVLAGATASSTQGQAEGALPKPAPREIPAGPYQYRWTEDGWILGACAAGGAGAAIVEGGLAPMTVQEIDRLSRDDVNRFDRGATFNYSRRISEASYVLVGAVVASPLVLLLDHEVKSDWEAYSVMYTETLALAAIIPAFAKGTVKRTRPFVYNPDVPVATRTNDDPRGSFFSRHTSMAFASAVFLCTVHHAYHPDSSLNRYLWAGSLLAATGVGLMRIESGQHFPTDALVGAAVGSAIGYAVPRLHRHGNGKLTLRPVLGNRAVGIAFELKR